MNKHHCQLSDGNYKPQFNQRNGKKMPNQTLKTDRKKRCRFSLWILPLQCFKIAASFSWRRLSLVVGRFKMEKSKK